MKAKIVQAAIFIILGLLSIVEGRSILIENTKVYGSNLAGLYLIVLGAVLGLLSLGHFLSEKRTPAQVEMVVNWGENISQKAWFVLLLAALALAISYLGFVLSTLGFFVVYLRFFGKYEWKRVLILAISFSMVFGIIFDVVGMNLPKGFFDLL